jgi:hypothetical protein
MDNLSEVIDEHVGTVKFLPNRYRKYGVAMFVIALPILMVLIWSVKENWPEFYKLHLKQWSLVLFSYPITIGLALFVFSKDKVEDERIQLLRIQSFVYGVYLMIVLSLGWPLLSNLSSFVQGHDLTPKTLGGLSTTTNFLLLYIYGSFQVRKYLEKKKLADAHEK